MSENNFKRTFLFPVGSLWLSCINALDYSLSFRFLLGSQQFHWSSACFCVLSLGIPTTSGECKFGLHIQFRFKPFINVTYSLQLHFLPVLSRIPLSSHMELCISLWTFHSCHSSSLSYCSSHLTCHSLLLCLTYFCPSRHLRSCTDSSRILSLIALGKAYYFIPALSCYFVLIFLVLIVW